MNLYDLNKQLVEANDSPMDPIVLSRVLEEKLKEYIDIRGFEGYHMLLCNEEKDYTVFNVKEKNMTEFVSSLQECLVNRGYIYSISIAYPNKDALEIWIRNKKGMFCYYFFKYDEGVVEVI